jgi:hypothetical protein
MTPFVLLLLASGRFPWELAGIIGVAGLLYLIMVIRRRRAPAVKKIPFTEMVAADPESDELVAVLTASACEVLQKPLVVKRIQFIASPENTAWSVTGRLNIMASHLIPKRK